MTQGWRMADGRRQKVCLPPSALCHPPSPQLLRLSEVQREVEPCALFELGGHLQFATHGRDEFLADRKAEACARERIVAGGLTLAERLEQAAHHVVRNSAPGVLHRELNA